MNLKLSSSSIEAEVFDLNTNMLKPHPQKVSYYNGIEDDDIEKEYYLQFFNDLKDSELIYFLHEVIEVFSGGVIFLVCKPKIFQSLVDLKLIGDVNKNVQFHIGLTNGIINDTTNIINNDNKRKSYMKYNFGIPVEATYITSKENINEYSKITFHLNRKLRSMERNSIYERNSICKRNSICENNKNPYFLLYIKYETNINGEYDGFYLFININDDKCMTISRHYQHGKIISEIRR